MKMPKRQRMLKALNDHSYWCVGWEEAINYRVDLKERRDSPCSYASCVRRPLESRGRLGSFQRDETSSGTDTPRLRFNSNQYDVIRYHL